ncbi:MAG: M20 family metallopeptidase [Bacillota bacterium]|jgi:glutamate carboxypeptidase
MYHLTVQQYLVSRLPWMLDDLCAFVEMDSPSNDKKTLDLFSTYLERRFREELGCRTTIFPGSETGNHLRVSWGKGTERTLILCHMDTVWPVGEAERRPFRVHDGRAYGPGVLDMKGGIVIGFHALKVLRDLGLHPCREVVVLLTSDEEVGSNSSKDLIESEAQASSAVLVLEPAVSPSGALKTWRKGIGRFVLEVIGRASHAGADPGSGVDAVQEISHQITSLYHIGQDLPGVTVNVGIVEGGTRPNVVAAYAKAEIDVRIMTLAQGEKMLRRIRGLKPVNPQAEIRVTGDINRLPMERSPGTVFLYQKARSLAKTIGLDVLEDGSGGCSDGNITSVLGVPTLDGLGAVGGGGHSLDEYVLIDKLPERAALLVLMLLSP